MRYFFMPIRWIWRWILPVFGLIFLLILPVLGQYIGVINAVRAATLFHEGDPALASKICIEAISNEFTTEEN